jgi:hypothetical protein
VSDSKNAVGTGEYSLWCDLMSYAHDRRDDTLRQTLCRLRPHFHHVRFRAQPVASGTGTTAIRTEATGSHLCATQSDEKPQEDKVCGYSDFRRLERLRTYQSLHRTAEVTCIVITIIRLVWTIDKLISIAHNRRVVK